MVNFVVNFSNDTLYGDVQLCMQAYNCLYYTIICIVFVCVFFFTGIFYIFLFKRNRIHHWCLVSTGKSQPEVPPFQWETRLGIFLSTLNIND